MRPLHHRDSCDEATDTCVHTVLAVGEVCDDSNPCTTEGTCDDAGACVTALAEPGTLCDPEDDENPCTLNHVGQCDAGSCVHYAATPGVVLRGRQPLH